MGNESFLNEEDVLEGLLDSEIDTDLEDEDLYDNDELDALSNIDTYSDDYDPNEW